MAIHYSRKCIKYDIQVTTEIKSKLKITSSFYDITYFTNIKVSEKSEYNI